MSNNFIPDAKAHLLVSLTKSIVRIFGYALLFLIPNGGWAAVVLIGSEVLGICEELV